MTNTEKLQKMYDESNYVVFFGGAGVSTESGIPDFRSATGFTICITACRPRLSSVTRILCLIPRSFTGFTEISC